MYVYIVSYTYYFICTWRYIIISIYMYTEWYGYGQNHTKHLPSFEPWLRRSPCTHLTNRRCIQPVRLRKLLVFCELMLQRVPTVSGCVSSFPLFLKPSDIFWSFFLRMFNTCFPFFSTGGSFAPLCWSGEGFQRRCPRASLLNFSGQPCSSSRSPNPREQDISEL